MNQEVTMDIKEKMEKQRRLFSMLFFIVGIVLVLIGLGYLPFKKIPNNVPGWIVTIGGLIFCVSSIMTKHAENTKYVNLAAAILIFLMGIIGCWAALRGEDGQLTSGIKELINGEAHISLKRGMFGIGALACFWIAITTGVKYLKQS